MKRAIFTLFLTTILSIPSYYSYAEINWEQFNIKNTDFWPNGWASDFDNTDAIQNFTLGVLVISVMIFAISWAVTYYVVNKRWFSNISIFSLRQKFVIFFISSLSLLFLYGIIIYIINNFLPSQ